ncbi:unnamed protein product [Mytilus coruscus]|uniref:B box-type domain-containing protein n=1 Tax=Mytilus coruscus TaxID=42192 RepID=A0A6J8A3Z5_MYTCO|nr:unnamed protein product [Mytilus coruscus]
MTSTNSQVCSLCKEDGIKKNAVTWCADCDTFLCINCDKHHTRNRASNQHKTLPSDDYQKLPDFILKKGNKCLDHGQNYELYCPDHSAVCCLQCLTEKHQKCKDLKCLHDILQYIKSSAFMSRLEKDLNDAKENYESIGIHLEDRLSKVMEQKKTEIEKIQCIRKSVNTHLDKLEQNLMNKLDEEHTKLKAKTEKLVDLVKTKSSHIKHLQEDLSNIKNFATELQSFIGLKEIAETTTREIGYLHNLPLSGELDELSFKVNISSGLQSVFQKITCFGSVSVSSMPSNLKLKKEVECQAPIYFPTVKTIDEINPVLKRKITLPKKKGQYNITGCQILPNGYLLFVDFSGKQLLQCNNYGIFITEVISFVDNPVSVCSIKDNIAAVTLPNSYQILKIDVVSGEIISQIKRGNKCYDIDSNGETICVVEKTGSKEYIAILDLSGKELRCIKMNGSFWSCATIFKH